MICTDHYLTCPGITQLFAPVVQLAEFHADIYFDITRYIRAREAGRGKKKKKKGTPAMCLYNRAS